MNADNNFTLLVLAAGMGSRYGGIKQIDGFGPNGETIMDYSLFDALRAGFNKVVFIVREDILDTVKEIFLPKLKGKAEVEWVIQTLESKVPQAFHHSGRSKPWGTAHAMLCARDVIHEPFAVINADDFYGPQSYQSLIQFFKHNPHQNQAMVGYTLKNVLSDYGSVSRGCGERDDENFLKSVVERTVIVKEGDKIISKEPDGDVEMDPETPTSMNFWGFYPSIFDLTEKYFEVFLERKHQNPKAEFFIPLVVNDMIQNKEGKVKIIPGGDIWFGVTYQNDKEIVAKKIKDLIAQGKYPEKLW